MTRRRSNIRLVTRGWLLFMLLLAAVVPGCKKDAPPPPAVKVAPLPTKPGQVQTTLPANAVQAKVSTAKKPVAALVQKQLSSSTRLQPPGTVNLDFTSRRDPFKPFAQMPAAQAAAGKAGKTAKKMVGDPLPIQTCDVEKFRVTGIITGLKENSALVIGCNEKGYVIKEGMPIGNNDGRVKRITNSTVEVEEVSIDDKGRNRKRLVKLTLIRKK